MVSTPTPASPPAAPQGEPDPPHRTLRSRVLHGVAWKGASRLLVEGSKAAVGLILARLLTPDDFGLAAMAMVFVGIIPIFSGLALGAALVQRPTLDENDRSTAFWTGLALGVVLTIAGILLSPLLARFYGEPDVQPLFAALSFGFVLTSLGMTQGQLLVRDMEFRALEIRTMTGTVVGAAAGVTVALLGMGPWAIIVQQLAATATATALMWLVSPWRPRFLYSMTSLRQLAGFGGNVSATMVLNEVNMNADNLLIGRFLGPSALGVYAVAYNIMLVPFSRITSPLQEVLYSAFSRIQDDAEQVRAVWFRVNRLVAALSMPALAGLAIVAPDAIHVILGDQWSEAAPVVRILAWVGIVSSLQGLNVSVLQARDRTGALLRVTIMLVAANLTAFILGLQWGIIGVAACLAVTSTLVQPIASLVAARAVGSGLGPFLRNLTGVAIATAVMAAAVLATRWALITQTDVGPTARLLVAIAVGLATFLPMCALTTPEIPEEVRRLLRQRGRPTPELVS